MEKRTIGVIMNGVTGRMGKNQHLARSLMAIRAEGGLALPDGSVIWPEPILTGRNEHKLAALAAEHGGLEYSTDLDALLTRDDCQIYFDAQTTDRRVESCKKAIAAGKHLYCEKPTACDSASALDLYQTAKNAGVKHGVVQDKLWLPGLLKLKYLIDTGFFGRILAVRGEFGYWVYPGEHETIQRPSWNYRKADGGGIIIDMLCHWRYVIDNLFGKVTAVSCLGANHVKTRWDESGNPYNADCDDAAYATITTDQDIICHFNSSWCTRVQRDDLLTVHVDGMNGSAVAGLRNCVTQHNANTPKPVWNPDIDSPICFRDGWAPVPTNERYDNAFKAEWELFLKHVVLDEPFRWDLLEGAKGVQLAELGLKSWADRAWMDVPDL